MTHQNKAQNLMILKGSILPGFSLGTRVILMRPHNCIFTNWKRNWRPLTSDGKLAEVWLNQVPVRKVDSITRTTNDPAIESSKPQDSKNINFTGIFPRDPGHYPQGPGSLSWDCITVFVQFESVCWRNKASIQIRRQSKYLCD